MNVHQTIIQGIKEQLFLNSYLVLPGFGGFVLKKTPSHFSSAGGTIAPPGKNIGFNAQLKQNDGILAQWLQSSLSCDNTAALNHLSNFAAWCQSVLANKGRLNIEGLGFFYTDLENNVCFEPQLHTNFLTSSFGLAPVQLKELEPEPEKKEQVVYTDRIITQTETVPAQKIRRYRKMAVMAVSGAVLFSALLLAVSNSKISGKLTAAIVGKEHKTLYTPIAYHELSLKNTSASKKDYVADINGIASLALEENKTIAVKAIEVAPVSTDVKKNHTIRKSIRRSGNFEVVLGCFGVLNNAHRLVKQLGDSNIAAEVSGKNEKGLYVVSGGGFNSREEAISQLAQLKDSCPNAWIRKAE